MFTREKKKRNCSYYRSEYQCCRYIWVLIRIRLQYTINFVI